MTLWQQQSYKMDKHGGVLYLVPTPIGNLEDMTFRGIRILKEADVIAAEDTRQTIKLLNHFEIQTKLISYHEHNKEASGENIISQIKQGAKVALVSDAGTPAISDPGYELVRDCIKENIAVIPLPGANAAITSFIASGFPTNHFLYYGFVERQKKQKQAEFETLKDIAVPIIFYEAPHRLKETLHSMRDVFGNRNIVVCRELTKKYEEIIRGTMEEVIQWCEVGTIKGEFCFIVEGNLSDAKEEQDSWWSNLTIEQHVNHYVSLHLSTKEAIKQVAKERNVPKREVYAVYHT